MKKRKKKRKTFSHLFSDFPESKVHILSPSRGHQCLQPSYCEPAQSPQSLACFTCPTANQVAGAEPWGSSGSSYSQAASSLTERSDTRTQILKCKNDSSAEPFFSLKKWHRQPLLLPVRFPEVPVLQSGSLKERLYVTFYNL